MEKITRITECDICPFLYGAFVCQYYSRRIQYEEVKPDWCKVKRIIIEEE